MTTNIILTLIVFLQTLLFAFFHQNSRKLVDKGVLPHTIGDLQKWSIVPAIALFALTYKPEYLHMVLENKAILLLILGIASFWTVGQYSGYFMINSTSSLSFLDALTGIFNLPILAVMGILINKDMPNAFAFGALALLMIALLIKPKQNKENKRNLFNYGFWIVFGIIILNIVAHGFDGTLYRKMLGSISPAIPFGISIYILTASIMLNILYFFKKVSPEQKALTREHKWLAMSVPAIWFAASLPEGYSFSQIPIFTLTCLGSFSFLVNVVSDLRNKRITFNYQTAIFVVLVVASIGFSTLSLK